MSSKHTNGSGNGHDKDDKNIVEFPTLAERDRMRREERKEEERWRKSQKKRNSEPFLKAGNIPPFTKYLIVAFLLIHIPLYVFADSGTRLAAIYNFGFIPGRFTGAFEWSALALLTPLTYTLLHGSWMHVLFNTVMGLTLGMFVERIYGARATALFFLLCTLGGAAVYFAFSPESVTPVVGASGGISGFFGAAIYVMMTQNTNSPLAQRFGKYGPWPILGFWGLLIVGPGLLIGADISWQAHLGGYLVGLALVWLIQNRKIRL